MSDPSHQAASRISAAWQAHKEQMKPLGAQDVAFNAMAKPHVDYFQGKAPDYRGRSIADMINESALIDGPDRGIEARRARSLPPLTPIQQAD